MMLIHLLSKVALILQNPLTILVLITVFGVLKLLLKLPLKNRIALEQMSECVLEQLTPLERQLVNGTDNFVSLAKLQVTRFKLRSKLMVFPTIVTLVQKLPLPHRIWTSLQPGQAQQQHKIRLKLKMKLIHLSVIFRNQLILRFQLVLDTPIMEKLTIPCGVLPHLVL
jgi:hypothetical protein